jgi:hypothetical protein
LNLEAAIGLELMKSAFDLKDSVQDFNYRLTSINLSRKSM